MLLVVTLLLLTLAAVMSGVVWRMVRDERRRSRARVEALAAAIHGEENEVDIATWPDERNKAVPFAGHLFGTAEGRPGWARVGLAAALGAFVVGSVALVAVVLSAGSRTTGAAPAAPTARAANSPLELVELGHELTGGTLAVRGVVRNPRDAAPVNQVAAVVFVFSRSGGFVASRRALVATPSLAPGAESTFAVTVPGMSDVGRYRVGFRANDRVIVHIDRRERGVPLS